MRHKRSRCFLNRRPMLTLKVAPRHFKGAPLLFKGAPRQFEAKLLT